MVVVEYCVWLWVWSISTSAWKRNGVFCFAPVGIIRGYAAHPIGVAVALLWRCLALGARLELGVRTNTPDDANKKP